jgi:hypothetical protein
MAFADQLDAAILAQIRSGNADTTAAGLRTVLDLAADAIRTLETLARGAGFELQNRNPLPADGIEGDGWLNAVSGDAFRKESGVWVSKGNLKGPPGTVTSGQNGLSAYQVAVQQGYSGSAAQWLTSLRGATGQSAYQAAVAGGFAGTQAQWLESLKGAPGDNGTEGNRIRWEGYAPTDEAASVGDLWIHSISNSQFALYECRAPAVVSQAPSDGGDVFVVSNWRLRFTSPDPGTSPSGGGTVKSVNGVGPDGNGNVQVSLSGGSNLPAQTGNAGKVLGTDGTTASWVAQNAGAVNTVSIGTNTPISPDGNKNITLPLVEIPYFQGFNSVDLVNIENDNNWVLGATGQTYYNGPAITTNHRAVHERYASINVRGVRYSTNGEGSVNRYFSS